ncbi:unnamed protein product [Trichobilharzia szidati]|nr:unnamed protein product [Trichobilharzia szidati]
MAHLSTTCFIMAGLLMLNLVEISPYVLQAEMKFDDKGNRYVKTDTTYYGLDKNHVLTIKVDDCVITLDFSPPKKTEIKEKKGTRKVTVTKGCDKVFQKSAELKKAKN